MSKLILEPGDRLVDPAYDKHLDGHPTRRELQQAFGKIGVNMTAFWEGLDTQAIVGNFLCEKLGVTRGELDAYVAKKAGEIKAQQEAAQAASEEAKTDAQPNS